MIFPLLTLMGASAVCAEQVYNSSAPQQAVVTSQPQQQLAMQSATSASVPVQSTTTTTTTTVAPVSPQGSTLKMTPAQFRLWLATIQHNRRKNVSVKTTTRKVKLPPPPPLTYEQGQQVQLATLPKSPDPVTQDEEDAFQTMMQQNIPMSPQQIVRMRQMIDLSQRASAVTPNIPPKSVSSTIMVNLAPGATPPAVRLSQGYVSSLVFVDSTGTPWPIASFDVGNPKAVNMQWDGKSNILLIQSVAPYTSGDIVVRLVGLATPITLELVSGQRVVDYRVDLHVAGIGPNTKELPIGSDLPNSANQLLLGVLDGVAPAGSRQLNITGAANTQAWMLGDRIYLRTRLTLLSPGWVGKMVSPDGMNAYELPRTSSVLVSRYGEPVQLKVEGF